MAAARSESDSEPESDVPVAKRTKRITPVANSNDVKPTVAPSKQKGIQKGILQDLPNMPLDIIDEVSPPVCYGSGMFIEWQRDRFFHMCNSTMYSHSLGPTKLFVNSL